MQSINNLTGFRSQRSPASVTQQPLRPPHSSAIPTPTDRDMRELRQYLINDALTLSQFKNISHIVLKYLTQKIPVGFSQQDALSSRVLTYISYLNRQPCVSPENKITLLEQKLRFLDYVLDATQGWSHRPLPSPALLGLLPGYPQRTRVLDGMKQRPLVCYENKALLLSNTHKYGQGSFGKVKSAIEFHNTTATRVAVKRMPCRYLRDGQTSYTHLIQSVREYLIALTFKDSPNILGAHMAYFYDDGKLPRATPHSRYADHTSKMAIVMQEADCNAADHLDNIFQNVLGREKIIETLHVFTHASRALADFEQHGYVHNDFKLENLLLMKDNHIKLGDFGAVLSIKEPIQNTSFRILNQGTYISPECLLSQSPYHPCVDLTKIDAFAFGVELFHTLNLLLTPNLPNIQYIPAHDNKRMAPVYTVNVMGHRIYIPANPVVSFIPQAQKRLGFIQSCYEHDPDTRIISCLCSLAYQCLAYDHTQRPNNHEINHRLELLSQETEIAMAG